MHDAYTTYQGDTTLTNCPVIIDGNYSIDLKDDYDASSCGQMEWLGQSDKLYESRKAIALTEHKMKKMPTDPSEPKTFLDGIKENQIVLNPMTYPNGIKTVCNQITVNPWEFPSGIKSNVPVKSQCCIQLT
ncbi:hypothetical protein KUTeg_002517 [Tegillarca granosa]|uniref:Uncharacterized protein n=1 Tax=Tegillarca granosa TaxID=220873 RepID=A0ABQ9FUM7_TEGGR|nr:hypothetical protein KUTeg_002517 [Tegillarca granosa]